MSGVAHLRRRPGTLGGPADHHQEDLRRRRGPTGRPAQWACDLRQAAEVRAGSSTGGLRGRAPRPAGRLRCIEARARLLSAVAEEDAGARAALQARGQVGGHAAPGRKRPTRGGAPGGGARSLLRLAAHVGPLPRSRAGARPTAPFSANGACAERSRRRRRSCSSTGACLWTRQRTSRPGFGLASIRSPGFAEPRPPSTRVATTCTLPEVRHRSAAAPRPVVSGALSWSGQVEHRQLQREHDTRACGVLRLQGHAHQQRLYPGDEVRHRARLRRSAGITPPGRCR